MKECECDDPGRCHCGGGLTILGRADPSGKVLDRWGPCMLCGQRGRSQMKDMLGSLARQVLIVLIVALLAYYAGQHGWWSS